MSANKIKELEERIRELEDAVTKLKKEMKNTLYDLDENNFSREFLERIKG